jgi:hypothetical protein
MRMSDDITSMNCLICLTLIQLYTQECLDSASCALLPSLTCHQWWCVLRWRYVNHSRWGLRIFWLGCRPAHRERSGRLIQVCLLRPTVPALTCASSYVPILVPIRTNTIIARSQVTCGVCRYKMSASRHGITCVVSTLFLPLSPPSLYLWGGSRYLV